MTSSSPFRVEIPCSEADLVTAEIAELTGERYTLVARLQWIDNSLDALHEQLKLIHAQQE